MGKRIGKLSLLSGLSALATALAAAMLSGCSNTQSEMTDAINQQLQKNPLTVATAIRQEPVHVHANRQSFIPSVAVIPQKPPAEVKSFQKQYDAMTKAYADLAGAGFLTTQTVDAYPDGSLGSNTVVLPDANDNKPTGVISLGGDLGPIMSDYIIASSPDELNQPASKAILDAINAKLDQEGMVNLSGSSQRFYRSLSSLDPRQQGAPDPDFFFAVQQDDTSPTSRQLAALTEAGYLREEDASTYIRSAGFFGGGDQFLFQNWTGGGTTFTQFNKPTNVKLYFMTPKAKGLVMLAKGVNYSQETALPSVRLFRTQVTKPFLIAATSYGGQSGAMVDFEEASVKTPLAELTPLVDALGEPIKDMLAKVTASPVANEAVVDTQPNGMPNLKTLGFRATYLHAGDIQKVTIYSAKTNEINVGEWKLKSVDNFTKTPDAAGRQTVQATFEFHQSKGVSSIADDLTVLGATVPKDGATMPYECRVVAMSKGFTVQGCFPVRR